MLDLPFDADSEQPAARKPTSAIQFSSAEAGGDGGLMDTASNVASAVGLDLSGGEVDPWARSIIDIQCQSFLAPKVGFARIGITDDSQSPSYAIGDTGGIELGFEDDALYSVFTGRIARVQWVTNGQANITVNNGAQMLSRLRINQSFEQQSAGEIVTSLAQQAGVELGAVEDGIDLPFHIIDDGLNAYQHIAALAERSGFRTFVNNKNQLDFYEIDVESVVQTFHYGVDIIEAACAESQPMAEKVVVVGAGAAGSQGAEAWSWLVKNPQSVSTSVGDGEKIRLVSDGSLRSAQAVQNAAMGRYRNIIQQSRLLSLTVPGASHISVGHKIEVNDVPQTACNGVGMVEFVRHSYNKHYGFITQFSVLMETDDAGLLAGALGGLGGLL